jgi:hypothetical protein
MKWSPMANGAPGGTVVTLHNDQQIHITIRIPQQDGQTVLRLAVCRCVPGEPPVEADGDHVGTDSGAVQAALVLDTSSPSARSMGIRKN